MSSESDQHLDEYVPGGGARYYGPITFGTIVVETTHDYMLQMKAIHTWMRSQGYDEFSMEMYDEDLGIEGDFESSYGYALLSQNAAKEIGDTSRFGDAALPDITEAAFEVNETGINALAEEFGVEALMDLAGGDSVSFPAYDPEGPAQVSMLPGVMPPRPPQIDPAEDTCVGILFEEMYSKRPFDLRRYGKWKPLLQPHMPKETNLGDEPHFDSMRRRHSESFGAAPLTLSSLSSVTEGYDTEEKSNMRPRGGVVRLCLSGGQAINVGTHCLNIGHDLFIPLDFSSSDIALAELFSAPAGEGLSCPTASHELHQAVEAVLSMAIVSANGVGSARVETCGKDIEVTASGHSFEIDITSTHGLWKKPVRKNRMAAVSKYDVGAVLVKILSGRPRSLFSALIANCLAIEHPAYYGLPDLSKLPKDLRVQYEISDRLLKLSQTTVASLSEMAYHAVVKASYDKASKFSYRTPGMSFKDKIDDLLEHLSKIHTNRKIAIPPYPLDKLSPLTSDMGDISVAGKRLSLAISGLQAGVAGLGFETPDPKKFLEDYPASAITSQTEAFEIADLIHSDLLTVPGEGFRGPVPEAGEEVPGKELWERVGQIYSHSSVAQFAEIRADLVRAINASPMPGVNKWRACPLMKGRVVAWYRSRDSANSPLGYRIDWFAVSSFPVIGSIEITSTTGKQLHLWPRQRLRSQEMSLAASLPRRLKLTLLSMLEKARAAGAKPLEIILAWQRLAVTATSSTWASGENYISCRHLSSSLSSPSPPFHEIKKKIKEPKTFACVFYISAVERALKAWRTRDQYRARCALLDLPRSYSQLESYWQVWVPNEFADPVKHMADCALSLFEEYQMLDDTFDARHADLLEQLYLVRSEKISFREIYDSVVASCSLDTSGTLGWSIWGSLGSAYALNSQGPVSAFDRAFSRGQVSRRITDHLTVRHSMRMTKDGQLQSGTVAELILKQGVDDYLSQALPTCRFYYGPGSRYYNHPKKLELKNREISIADPDSRILLNNAELICGSYGRHTKVDMLKRADKDAHFYRIAERALLDGGAIQASDATRFSAMMSNIATSITILGLGCMGGSSHLLSASSTYRRLASRQMVLDTSILSEFRKRLDLATDPDAKMFLSQATNWLVQMQVIGHKDQYALKAYTTSVHTGQGMSHHGTSLAHAGALLMTIAAAEHACIRVSGKLVIATGIAMVTSDDSTIVCGVDESKTIAVLSRPERQRACKQFLRVQQQARLIALRSVSVKANLPKEKISSVAGEFNSQDTGIGTACPILGFREAICQMVEPSGGSLVADYLAAEAYGRSVALSGQGLVTGVWAHLLALDALEQRWRLLKSEKNFIKNLTILPEKLVLGSNTENILWSPAACLPTALRGRMMTLSHLHNEALDDLNPHAADTCFGPCMHISVSMPKQHQEAIRCIQTRAGELEAKGMNCQAQLLRDSLRATLSSARTRNMGRVATRIRNRMVSPQDYDGKSFQRAPLLETTLTWLQHIENRVQNLCTRPEVRELVSSYGSKIVVANVHHSRFPRPPTRKRSVGIPVKAPIYILEPYGQSPFGLHAIERSGGKLVSSYGPDERGAFARYRAASAYRKIGEHVRYGMKFQLSWADMRAGTLKIRVEDAGLDALYGSQMLWADLNEESIGLLRSVETESVDSPVLAGTVYDGTKMHYHCVWHHRAYSHTELIAREALVQMSYHSVLLRGGIGAVVVIPAMSEEAQWAGSGPTKEEIKAFQHFPQPTLPNSQADALLSELDGKESLTVPTLAYCHKGDQGDVLYSCSRPYKKRSSRTLAPHERSKVIGTLALGGYWYTAMKGVAFRAYLKGHVGVHTSWTGTVLGWRTNSFFDPEYDWEPPRAGGVEYVAMIGGLDSDEEILAVNTDKYSTGKFYVDRDGLHPLARVYQLEPIEEVRNIILTLNRGKSVFCESGLEYQLVDAEVPETRYTELTASTLELVEKLTDIALGKDIWDETW
jgi:hypothetical protein